MFYAACGGSSAADEADAASEAGHQQHHQQVRVISMRSARYGRMRVDGRCVKRDYGYIGCASDVLGHVDRLCSGRRVCDFAVAELHGNQPCPNDLTPYLEAAYDCLPGA
jgi:Galactose binding lectin domain